MKQTTEVTTKEKIVNGLTGFIRKTWPFLTGGLAAVVILVSLFAFLEYRAETIEKQASRMLAEIDTYFDEWQGMKDPAQKKATGNKVIRKADIIAGNYPDTYANQRSQLYKGEILFERAKYEEASKTYRKAASIKSNYLSATALYCAASSYEEADQIDEALAVLNEILDTYSSARHLAPRVYFTLARLHDQNSEYKQAHGYYQDLIEYTENNKTPNSDFSYWTNIAQDRIIYFEAIGAL